MTYTIEHGFYGCDTGCCGYRLKAANWDEWTFSHPDQADPTDDELREFARREFAKTLKPEDEILIGEWRSCGL